MNDPRNYKNGNGDESLGAPITDELDDLLRDWHVENADAAMAGRDRLLAALRVTSLAESPDPVAPAARMASDVQIKVGPAPADAVRQRLRDWRAVAARFTPAAAAIILIAILIAFNPSRQRRSYADVIYAPDGGALTALDKFGRTKGPCPLKDTYVDVDISGRFARVTLWQTFHNPYNDKIEAVYTFPMSHSGTVDRMTMSIGERIIIGEVHERVRAKEIYETAKQQGHVAALLEQERPNIFTQSVANIEPGAEILVEISYVETITPRNGLCEFAFPMVVSPRFIPATDDNPLGDAANFATRREGVNLLAPGHVEIVERNEDFGDSALWSILDAAIPIEVTNETTWQSDADGNPTRPIATFKADYDALADEPGAIYSNGTGQINGRWFAFDRNTLSRGTTAVPDAPRITPPVAPPDTRAGHDITISVNLDTGGPGITEIETPLHDTTITSDAYDIAGLATHTKIELTNQTDIPNRDFVLRWRAEADEITDAVLTHTGDLGNFVTIMLDAPARVEADDLVPREIVFVIDTSGSMNGEPLNKAKQVMAQALEAMSPNDTFNVIAFSDSATPLWDAPREATIDNIDDAHVFVANHESKGGTQMMHAVRMALASDNTSPRRNSNNLTNLYNAIDLEQLATLSANGRHVVVSLDPYDIVALRPESDDDDISAAVILGDDASIYISGLHYPVDTLRPDEAVLLTGWLRTSADGEPYIEADEFGPALRPAHLLSPADLRSFTPDDRRLRLLINCEDIDGFTDPQSGDWIEGVPTDNDEFVLFEGFQIHQHDDASAMLLTGRWTGGDDARFVVESGIHVPREWTEPSPMRVVCFLTDGEVGNDMAIIDEIRRTADKTRFFSLGIGNSVNRYLLDGMAEAGRGAGDVILLEDDAHAAIQRFVQRMKAPVLLNPTIEFSDGLDIIDMQPEKLPDLFDQRPIVIHARYESPGAGTITIRGDAADGAFERTINVELPDYEPRHESLPSLWARAKVDAIMNRDLKAAQRGSFPAAWRNEIIELGETFQIMTQYTSFVAVERLNVTYGGQPVRIEVPVELPDGMAPEGEIARQLMINAENYESWPQRVDQEIAKQRELQEFATAMDALAQHDQAIGDVSDGDGLTDLDSESDAAASRSDTVDSPDVEQNSAALNARDTLSALQQRNRDRAALGARYAEMRESSHESYISGIPYHQDMTYPKNWPEIAARRRSIDELSSIHEPDILEADRRTQGRHRGNASNRKGSAVNPIMPAEDGSLIIEGLEVSDERLHFDQFFPERVEIRGSRPTDNFGRQVNIAGRPLVDPSEDTGRTQTAQTHGGLLGQSGVGIIVAPESGEIILMGPDDDVDHLSILASLEDSTTDIHGAELYDAVSRVNGATVPAGRVVLRGVAPTTSPPASHADDEVNLWTVARANSGTPQQFVAASSTAGQSAPDSTFGIRYTDLSACVGYVRLYEGDDFSETSSADSTVILSAGRDGRYGTTGYLTTREAQQYSHDDSGKAGVELRGARIRGAWDQTDQPFPPLDLHAYTVDSIPALDDVSTDEQGDSAYAPAGASSNPHKPATSTEQSTKQLGSRTRRVHALKNVNPEQAREMIEQFIEQSDPTPDSEPESKTREPTDYVDMALIGGRAAGAIFQGFDAGVPDDPDRAAISTQMNPFSPAVPLAEDTDEEGPSPKSQHETRKDDVIRRQALTKESVPRTHETATTDRDDNQSAARRTQMDADTGIKEAHKATDIFKLETTPEDQPVISFWSFGVETGATQELDQSIPVWSRLVPKVEFNTTSLSWILDCLGETVGTEITIDVDAIRSAGYACESRVTGHFEAGTFSEALSTLLEIVAKDREPLDFVATTEGLLITTQSAARQMLGLVIAAHNIADFFADEDLPTMITTHDATDMPPTWLMSRFIADIAAGSALTHAGRIRTNARFEGDNVIITHTPEFHRQIANWLAALRSARFESPTSAADVYRVAAGLRAGTHNADDVLTLLNAYPNDALARQLLDATLAQHANIVGPPPPLESVMAMAADELRSAASRTKRISTCIDEPLLALMAGTTVPTQESLQGEQDNATRSTPRRKPSSNRSPASPPRYNRHGVTVSVLLADSSKATLDAARQSGLKIESVATSANVAIGNIPLTRLTELATRTIVRRIEAATFHQSPGAMPPPNVGMRQRTRVKISGS